MRLGDEDAEPVAQERERLIQGAPDDGFDHEYAATNESSTEELIFDSPSWFVWSLTFSAGVSGLLFGYE